MVFEAIYTADRCKHQSKRYCGRSLSLLLGRRNAEGALEPISYSTRNLWAQGIARGMAYLHSRNVFHLDLSAKNVLISKDNVAKVSDFGLSKMRNGPMSVTSTGMGTLSYAAPERLQRREGGLRGDKLDVFSFGIIVYELATRQIPWKEWRMEELLGRCWAEDPAQRPSFLMILKRIECMMASEGAQTDAVKGTK
ncbi:hypothetical protein CYMTET_38109 [Cymbomonas tetramitiformis]|uniref:Protein kinase domain-containing protein n=1 Tax=Cymbomonas tetramitiformis TaxID=36881 RepID=A0AAE0CCK4_9CHLO|nr:hypothetical protein CYMTET_38109 [Cymbomonas tetramitiformis]